MYNLIAKYMKNLSIDQVNNFAKEKNILLNDNELTFTYNFIKKNWENILGNPALLNLERYKDKYSPDNYNKIVKLYSEYLAKYKNFL